MDLLVGAVVDLIVLDEHVVEVLLDQVLLAELQLVLVDFTAGAFLFSTAESPLRNVALLACAFAAKGEVVIVAVVVARVVVMSVSTLVMMDVAVVTVSRCISDTASMF